jgi:hypothetical protein
MGEENNIELKHANVLGNYFEPKKNAKKQYIHNFIIDLVNVIVLRPFGSDDYIFVKYNKASLTCLDQLRNHITWKHLDSLDETFKNEDL